MASNMLLFGWNRSIPGRERLSAEHFRDFVAYLGHLQGSGAIQSFDTIFLDLHGGDLNGFFLVRAEPAQLDALVASENWVAHMTRAGLHLEGAGVARGVTGDRILPRMELWSRTIPG
jgi:hypothetical protein